MNIDSGLIGIVIGVVGSAIAALAQYRNTVLKAKVAQTKESTDKELNEIGQALQSWKDINIVNTTKIKELDDEVKILREAIDEEQEKRHKCEVKLSEMAGKIEVLMSVQTRQIEAQDKQDLRQTERMDRSDVRQNLSDTRQDSSDKRQDKNDSLQTNRHEQQDVRQGVQDDRQDVTDEAMSRIEDEVKLASEHNGK